MARPWEVSADDIDAWASTASAAATLPKLVRRLLFATTPLRSLVMRADSGIHLAGWDGVVQSMRGTAFCPPGISYWELSTNADLKTKLDDDFKKRVDKRGADPTATYVAVTPRRFPGKERWAREKERQRAFAAVAAFDADDLATWLEQSPPVARWFASLLERPVAGGDDIETFLSIWERRTAPPLPSELALAGREREESASRVRSWLSAPAPKPIAIRGDTREEALVFVAAAIASRVSPESEQWTSRALVVKDLETWEWLSRARHAEPPILLPAFPEIDLGHAEHTARSTGAHVIVPLDAGAPVDIDAEVLDPIPYPRIADQLRRIGLADAAADKIARESGGKLAALQRIFGHVATPDWVVPNDLAPLLVMLLVGAWDPSSDADQAVIERLGADPRTVEALCVRLSSRADAPIEREVQWGRRVHWKWISPADAWRALARYLTSSQLVHFRDVAIDTLGERDPRYELPKGQRLYAAAQGKSIRCSGALRGGIAQSLVRLALSEELRARFQGSRGSEIASFVVSRILKDEWQGWASLSDLLPILAEASPPAFLERVERSLDRGSSGVSQLLHEEEQVGKSPHVSLLWALEALGWSPELMPRVAYALARLAIHEPSGPKTANRPIHSLTNLIHPLTPQSWTTVEERVATLSLLLERRPYYGDVGWKATVELYNGAHGQGILFPSYRPRYQPWEVHPKQHGSAPPDVERQLSAMLELLLEHAGSEPERWRDLLSSLWRYPADVASTILDQLGEKMNTTTDSSGAVWTSLRQLLSRVYNFGKTWSIPSELIERVAQLYRSFEPTDAVARIAWLFENGSDLPEPIEDWEVRQVRKLELQRAEIARLWSTDERWDLLARLIEVAVRKDLIGTALGAIGAAELDDRLLEGSGDERFSPIIPAFVWKRAEALGIDWAIQALRALMASGRPADARNVALARSPEPYLWSVVDSIGEPLRSEFWANVRAISGEYSPSDSEHAIRSLIAAGNVMVAARFAASKPDVVTSGRALEILEAVRALARERLEEFLRDGDAEYVVGRIFEIVDRDTTIDAGQVALLELGLFSLLDRAVQFNRSARGPRRLFEALHRDPSLFALLLSWGYKAEPEAALEAQTDQSRSQNVTAAATSSEEELKSDRAEAAYHILAGWHGYPGKDLPPLEREVRLRDWALEALRLSSEQHRKAMGEIEVAKVLARAPGAPEDELWPCRTARELLETRRFENLGAGLYTAKRNSRGATRRAIGEGGQQERALSAQLRSDARKLQVRWSQTASLLDRLADSYDREAEEWDLEARTDRRHWDLRGEEAPTDGDSATKAPVAATFERIESLSLQSVGPAPSLNIPLAERLTLLTGHNSAGKTFILDVLWWALTGSWADLFAWPRRDHQEDLQPEIALALPDGKRISCHYAPADEIWSRPAELGDIQALVIYCRVDGGFTLWDPIKSHEMTSPRAPNGQAANAGFKFTPQTLRDGLETDDGHVICNGFIRDVIDWRARRPELSTLLDRVLAALSAPDEPMQLAEPTRLWIRDARDFPTLRMPYGDVPLVHASAAVKRIFGLGYLLVWAWHEHREAARLAEAEPVDRMVLLFDEPEAHLHPIWQRRVIPALFETMKPLSESMSVQVVTSTHSPLVTASLEPIFDPTVDKLLHLSVEGAHARVREVPWAKQGDASDWLMSEVFGLAQARSAEAERAIEAAMDFVKGVPVPDLSTKDEVTALLRKTLPNDDPFLVRWETVLEPNAAEPVR